MRDFNEFEKLQILKIVQPKFELHSDDKAFIYYIYDFDRSKSESRSSPYMIELVFSTIDDKPDEDQLLEVFEK